MSRFANFRQGVREKVTTALGIEGNTTDDTAELSEEDLAKEEEDARKHESRLTIIIEKVRELYLQRGLVGSIDISRSLLLTCNTVSCDVDGTATTEESPADDVHHGTEDEKVPVLTKVAVRSAVRLLNRLEARAKNYKSKPFKDDMSVSGSTSITDPLGLTSVSISCSASVASLLSTSS